MAPTALKASTGRRRTQAERTALSDQRMYQSTIELLCEGGISRATLKEVGERSGYSRGLAAARFSTKAGLLAAVLQTMNERWERDVNDSIAAQSGLAALFACLDAVETFLSEQSMWTRALFVLWYESISNDEVKGGLSAAHVRERQRVAELVRQGQENGTIRPDVPPALFAVQFTSLIFGTIYQWHIGASDIDVGLTFANVRDNMRRLLASD